MAGKKGYVHWRTKQISGSLGGVRGGGVLRVQGFVWFGQHPEEGKTRVRDGLIGVDIAGGAKMGHSASNQLRRVLPGGLGRKIGWAFNS